MVWQFGQRAIIWIGLVGAALGDVLDVVDFEERFTAVGDVLDVAGAAGFSHLPLLRRMTARLAARERTGSADVREARVPSLPIQNASALSHSRRYSTARSLSWTCLRRR
jgi:hypothetical protein